MCLHSLERRIENLKIRKLKILLTTTTSLFIQGHLLNFLFVIYIYPFDHYWEIFASNKVLIFQIIIKYVLENNL